MCANYAINASLQKLKDFYGLDNLPDDVPFYTGGSLYPTHSGPFVLSMDGYLALKSGIWSLVPESNRDPNFVKKYSTHNAVSETIETKRLYQGPWQKGQRCVIPASHFVEWKGPAGNKTKLAIRPKGEDLFHIAGVYDREGSRHFSFTMLTCAPNEQMKEIHHRMPVILKDWREWLSPDLKPQDAKKLCLPYEGRLEARAMRSGE